MRSQRALALDLQDVVRVDLTFGHRFTRLHEVARVDRDALPFGIRVLDGAAVSGVTRGCACPSSPARRTSPAISCRHHGEVLGLPRLEQVDDAHRPPVMSLVFAVSRGILATMSPGVDLHGAHLGRR